MSHLSDRTLQTMTARYSSSLLTRLSHQTSAQLRPRNFVQRVPRRAFMSAQKANYPQTPHKQNKPVERFSQFDLDGKVVAITGGGQGLALSMAEGIVEAGATVHVLDRQPEGSSDFDKVKKRLKDDFDGDLIYHQVDVTHDEEVEKCFEDIAAEKQRLDGLIAAAAVQQVTPALEFEKEDIEAQMEVNYIGTFIAARACARQMLHYKNQGSIVLIGSMSGTIANKGFISSVYNSSKASVIQLARNLAMEWGRIRPDGSGGIRVNSLSPGHIVTPMVEENFKNGEADRKQWESANMLGRLSSPEEYKGVGLFMLSRASSYMTGHDLKIDGGTTAW